MYLQKSIDHRQTYWPTNRLCGSTCIKASFYLIGNSWNKWTKWPQIQENLKMCSRVLSGLICINLERQCAVFPLTTLSCHQIPFPSGNHTSWREMYGNIKGDDERRWNLNMRVTCRMFFGCWWTRCFTVIRWGSTADWREKWTAAMLKLFSPLGCF